MNRLSHEVPPSTCGRKQEATVIGCWRAETLPYSSVNRAAPGFFAGPRWCGQSLIFHADLRSARLSAADEPPLGFKREGF